MEAAGPKLRMCVDADACPVKDKVYRVAARYRLIVFVLANSPIVVPRATEIEQVVVGAGPDIDWSEHRVNVDVTRDQVKSSPVWDPLALADQVGEQKLHRHFGWPGHGW